MEELFTFVIALIVILRIVGSVLGQAKERQQRQPREEEAESPYSVPPSTLEAPMQRRAPRPRIPEGERPVRVEPPRQVRRPSPYAATRQPRPRITRPPREVRVPPRPQIPPSPMGAPAKPPPAMMRREPPARRMDFQMDPDPIVNGIIWAEILGQPRCFSPRSPIASRW